MMPSDSASAKPFNAAFSVCEAGYVDGWIGVTASAGGIEHFGIAFRCCDRHGFIIARGMPARPRSSTCALVRLVTAPPRTSRNSSPIPGRRTPSLALRETKLRRVEGVR